MFKELEQNIVWLKHSVLKVKDLCELNCIIRKYIFTVNVPD